MKKIWWNKHRPKSISDFIFQNEEHKDIIKKYINDKSFPHLLLHGIRGTGKTTLANILINNVIGEENMGIDLLMFNGSDFTSIDHVRKAIKPFISQTPIGDFKIVFIDEADKLSKPAQDSLKHLLEEYESNARFIFTCNYINRLTPEIRSRFNELKFVSVDKEKVLKRCVKILASENVKIETEEDLKIIETYIDLGLPDFRKIISLLEKSVKDEKLVQGELVDSSLQYKLELIDYLNNDNWMQAREKIIENVNDSEWEELYKFLYEYLDEIEKFKNENKWKAGIVIIADYLYRHAFCADPEINLTACLIKLSEI